MSSGEEVAVLGGIAALLASPIGGVAAAGALAVTAAGTVLAVGVGSLAAIGYGLYQAGLTAAEIAKIAKENREEVRKATEKYLESLKLDEEKSDEFVKRTLEYFDKSDSPFTKEEAEKIISKEKTADKRVTKAKELLDIASTYEMAISNLYTMMSMMKTFGEEDETISTKFDEIKEHTKNLEELKKAIKEANDEIVAKIREMEKSILESPAKIFSHEGWKIVTEERDVIAGMYKDDIAELFEKTNDRELLEAKLKLEINQKRLILMNMYNTLSDLRGFPLFEDEAKKVLTETLALFQEGGTNLTDSGLSAVLDNSLEEMKSIYNRCAEKCGRELLEAKNKFMEQCNLNNMYRKEIGLSDKEFTFDEAHIDESVNAVLEDNERLIDLYKIMKKNEAFHKALVSRFHKSGYRHIPSAHRVEHFPSGLIKTTDYYITPDEECCVIVSTYSDGRPAQILCEGIEIEGFDADKDHILKVQKGHCAKSKELLDGLIEGEIDRIMEPSEETAIAIPIPELPEDVRKRAKKARKERIARKKTETKKKYIDE